MTKDELNLDDDLDLDALISEFLDPEQPKEPEFSFEPRHRDEPEAAVDAEAAQKIPADAQPEEEPVRKPAAKRTKNVQKSAGAVTRSVAGGLGKLLALVTSIAVTAVMLAGLFLVAGPNAGRTQGKANDVTIMDKYDMFMTNQISNALDGVLQIEKVYWLSDSDQVAPKPKQDNFGYTDDPKDLDPVLREARQLTGNRKLAFSMDRPFIKEAGINYYRDETILVITWKEAVNNVVYTISEVVIGHPSQFRRFLAGGEFGSDKQYFSTEMAVSVNAVVASSGDFYKFRRNGIVVYDRKVQRFENRSIHTCYIDDNGDMQFTLVGEPADEAAAQKYVDDNNIRFSLCFGPVLIDNGEACPPSYYPIGEIRDTYARMALCQKGSLHYLLVNAAGGYGYNMRPTIYEFTDFLTQFDLEKAYTLDGGQTTVISMNGQAISRVEFGTQRQISDIIYFATALPEGE